VQSEEHGVSQLGVQPQGKQGSHGVQVLHGAQGSTQHGKHVQVVQVGMQDAQVQQKQGTQQNGEQTPHARPPLQNVGVQKLVVQTPGVQAPGVQRLGIQPVGRQVVPGCVMQV